MKKDKPDTQLGIQTETESQKPAAGQILPNTQTTETLPASLDAAEQPGSGLSTPQQDIAAAIDNSRVIGGSASSPYATSQNLAQGLLGEKLAAESLAASGHQILYYKPDIKGTNQGGFDIVTLYEDKLYVIDNKSFTTGKSIASISALTENYEQNVQTMCEQFKEYINDPQRSDFEKKLYSKAVDIFERHQEIKAATNAGVALDGKHASGLSQGLQQAGIQFIKLVGKETENSSKTAPDNTQQAAPLSPEQKQALADPNPPQGESLITGDSAPVIDKLSLASEPPAVPLVNQPVSAANSPLTGDITKLTGHMQ